MKRKPTSSALHRVRWLTVAASATVLVGSLAVWAASKDMPAASPDKTDKTDKTAHTAKTTEPAANGDELPPAKPDTVRILVQTVPPRKAQVKWGGKSLGTIPTPRPLVVERPRDSGPLDLVIRASGFLPVHTRAYTFSDSRVAVKLTPPAEKNKLFGYREEIAPNPDAGVSAEPVAPLAPAAPVAPPAAPAPPATTPPR